MNLPNKISTARICLIPLVVFFYLASFIPFSKIIAAFVFAVASLTDMIDGKIARSRNLITTLGKFLDSIADKLLVVAGLVLICFDIVLQPYGIIMAIIIISRELIISAFRQIAAANNFIMAADMWGKVKATVQFIAVMLFMIVAGLRDLSVTGTIYSILEITSYICLIVATILTIISALHYMIKNKNLFKQEN